MNVSQAMLQYSACWGPTFIPRPVLESLKQSENWSFEQKILQGLSLLSLINKFSVFGLDFLIVGPEIGPRTHFYWYLIVLRKYRA